MKCFAGYCHVVFVFIVVLFVKLSTQAQNANTTQLSCQRRFQSRIREPCYTDQEHPNVRNQRSKEYKRIQTEINISECKILTAAHTLVTKK